MCLGVPGQVLEIRNDPLGMTMGSVSFAGITKEVCLAYLPEVAVGDYVIVHVGFAISKVDEEEAHQVFEWLEQMGELEELQIPQPGAGDTATEEPAPGRRAEPETQLSSPTPPGADRESS